jgi:hypothetical protein
MVVGVGHNLGHPEVANLEDISHHQYVKCLDIPMDDVVTVNVVDSLQKLV